MPREPSIRRYRSWYAKLLRLYPKPYRQRFGEAMEQTFGDLLSERAGEERRLFGFALWMFAETSGGIVRENMTSILRHSKNLIRIALGTALILLVPLLAMQFTDAVAWGLADFVVAGALLLGTGLTYELLARKVRSGKHRVAIGVAILVALLLVWADLAVGVFNIPGFSGS